MAHFDAATAAWVQDAIVFFAAAFAFAELRNMHRSTQFGATQSMIASAFDPQFYESVQFVFHQLPAKLNDETYRRELESPRGWAIDARAHPEMIVLARMEEAGIYLRHGLVTREAVLDYLGGLFVQGWDDLRPVVALRRSVPGQARVWESAKYLVEMSRHAVARAERARS